MLTYSFSIMELQIVLQWNKLIQLNIINKKENLV